MPQRLPFDVPEQIDDHKGGVAGAQCPIHNLLAPELRDEAEAAPHLMSYLHKVPFAEFGVPDYYPEASRKMGDIKDPNLIYPVGDNTFIHIFPDHRRGAELLRRHRAGHRQHRRPDRGDGVPPARLRRDPRRRRLRPRRRRKCCSRRSRTRATSSIVTAPTDEAAATARGQGKALAARRQGRGWLSQAAVRRWRRRRRRAARSSAPPPRSRASSTWSSATRSAWARSSR